MDRPFEHVDRAFGGAVRTRRGDVDLIEYAGDAKPPCHLIAHRILTMHVGPAVRGHAVGLQAHRVAKGLVQPGAIGILKNGIDYLVPSVVRVFSVFPPAHERMDIHPHRRPDLHEPFP